MTDKKVGLTPAELIEAVKDLRVGQAAPIGDAVDLGNVWQAFPVRVEFELPKVLRGCRDHRVLPKVYGREFAEERRTEVSVRYYHLTKEGQQLVLRYVHCASPYVQQGRPPGYVKITLEGDPNPIVGSPVPDKVIENIVSCTTRFEREVHYERDDEGNVIDQTPDEHTTMLLSVKYKG